MANTSLLPADVAGSALTEEQLDQFDAKQVPAPLGILPDMTDETCGYNPPNIETVILFQRVDANISALMEDVRSEDGKTLFDFARIVPPPQGIAGRAARRWGNANWGVDHNAGGARLVERLGFRGIAFFTEAFPEAVLKALAAKHPAVSWTMYACAWQMGWGATGGAAGGEFKFRVVLPKRTAEEDNAFETIRLMAFGERETGDPEEFQALIDKTREEADGKKVH